MSRVRAKPGLEDLVKLILLQLVAETRTEEGCISYDLHQSTTEPDLFLFYENWASREHLERHLESAHIQAFRRKAGELLAEPSDFSLWEKLD